MKEGVGIPETCPEECVEEFWQLLGKLELLRGYLVYEVGQDNEGKVSLPVLEDATRHFAFAAAYFERYSKRAYELDTTLKRIYDLFKKCRYDDLKYIQKELLPAIAETYALDPTQLSEFFEDTLGLALQLEP